MINKALTVLLVEDNLDHKELIIRNFNNSSKKIDHVVDGEAALDYLFRRGDYTHLKGQALPHLVLLDLRLPKIDGLDVLKEIKQSARLKHLPVVILTTSESDQDLGNAYHNYANSYLVKPIESDDFIKLMSMIALYWIRHNRTKPRTETK